MMKTSTAAKQSILINVRILIILFCWLGMLPAQKPSGYFDRLEIISIKKKSNFRTEYGRKDPASGALRYIYQENYVSDQPDPKSAGREYLLRHGGQLGISSPQQDLYLLREIKSPAGRHLIYRQQVQGIPVYNSGIVLTMNDWNTVVFVSSTFQPHLKVNGIKAAIASGQAVGIAEKYLGGEDNFSGAHAAAADLMFFNRVLVYRIQLVMAEPRGDWELLVDAQKGNICQARNLLRFQSGRRGQGLIWNPDPLTSAGVYYGGFFMDNNDADATVLNSQREPVILNDLKYENGKYYLDGPYVKLVDIDNKPADLFPALGDSSAFNFTRHQQEFEDVMVYYNIDRAGRYLAYLGFEIDSLAGFRADPHGLNGGDNSYYSPFENNCVFGEGGVDDAEDADVIWHEYAHAIMAQIYYPQIMDYEGETAALEEGSADYWAASNSRAISDFAWGQLFIWDAGIGSAQQEQGIFWAGRRCDLDWHYPEDYDFNADKQHYNGQIWSSALMHIWSDLGREITDRLFIQTIYLWGLSPDFHDAAQAFVQADQLLYGGRHLSTILYWFEFHGLIRSGETFPVINHDPLADSENLNGPYMVRVEIIPATAPLDTANLRLVWGYNGIFSDSLPLLPAAEPDIFVAEIPGPGQPAEVDYYLTAVDSAGYSTSAPGRAPKEYYSFRVGPDIQAPLILHTPLKEQSYWRWPAGLDVYASDNLGVDEVRVYYSVNQNEVLYSMLLEPAQAPGWFSGKFMLDTTQVEIGDSVHYMIQARDKSVEGNSSSLPQSGYYSFVLTAAGGEIVFDFEPDDGGMTAGGDWQWGIPASGPRSAFSGERLWATQLDGYYSNGPLVSTLLLPPVNLQGFEVAALQVWQWYDINTGGDGGNVKISADDGLNWQILRPLFGYDGILDTLSALPLRGEEIFCGNSSGWKKTFFNLDDYVDQKVSIKFEFAAGAAASGFGWYIDSLAIMEKSAKLYPPDNLAVLDDHVYIKLGWEYSRILKTIPGNSAGGKEAAVQPEHLSLFPEGLVFRIYRRQAGSQFNLIGETAEYTFTDSSVQYGRSYTYYLTSLAETLESEPSDTIQASVQAIIQVNSDGRVAPPQAYALQQNFPNPFNPATVICYQLPRSGQVKLIVYDLLGREVQVVVNGRQTAGYYEIEFKAGNLANGIYIYRLQSGGFVSTKKMILVR